MQAAAEDMALISLADDAIFKTWKFVSLPTRKHALPSLPLALGALLEKSCSRRSRYGRRATFLSSVTSDVLRQRPQRVFESCARATFCRRARQSRILLITVGRDFRSG